MCRNSNYVENLLILASAVTGWVFISVFVWLAGIPIGTTSSVKEIKIYTSTAGNQKYWKIMQKKRKNDNKRVLLS